MQFNQVIETLLCVLLVQNIVFEAFDHKCEYFKSKNMRKRVIKFFIISQLIVLPYIFIANALYSYLEKNNMIAFSIILFCFLYLICLQIAEIIYKKVSFIIELAPKTFTFSSMIACIQIGFISILILSTIPSLTLCYISMSTALFYCAVTFILSYFDEELEKHNIPNFAKGLPIKVFAYSILIFSFINIF